MNAIDADLAYVSEHVYWRLVEETLGQVFGIGDAEAAARVRALIDRLASTPPRERLLGFHAEPFSVAANLAGVVATDAQERQYLALAETLGWGVSASAAGADRPV